MGFRVAVGAFTAAEVGSPHERERLFIVAHADVLGPEAVHHGRPVAVRRGGGRAGVQGDAERVENHGAEEVVATAPDVAAVEYPRPWPPGPRDPAWCDVVRLDPALSPSVEEGGRARLNPTFVEWLMGFPRGWTEGASRSARLRMLGNAVAPHVAALAWRELSAAVVNSN
jgi:DNA (cytosine-5)-methyltransferase 1